MTEFEDFLLTQHRLTEIEMKEYPNQKSVFLKRVEWLADNMEYETSEILYEINKYAKNIVGFIANRLIGEPSKIKETNLLDLYNNFNWSDYSERIFYLALISLLAKKLVTCKVELTEEGKNEFYKNYKIKE